MATKTQTTKQSSKAFTDAEMDAMKNRAREIKALRSGEADGEADVQAKIAEMAKPDRVLAERFHALVKETAPELSARTWYGMPAYAKDGSVVCHFKNAAKFKTRYATVGFSDKAKLDDGEIWPTEFAVTRLSPAVEKQLVALLKKAVS
jgi:uncharacterized protein YdhG (YjbR/CyaY superfamily)